MGMATGEHKGIVADMNVVPLIDILLVLIIIFMVISPTTPKGLNALVPQPAPLQSIKIPEPLSNPIVVQVAANGRVKINQDEVSWEDLGVRLDMIFKGRAEKVAFVKGEDNVPFAEIARAIDIMRGSGIDKVGLITSSLISG
jgi:biopolymer transport protein TolR